MGKHGSSVTLANRNESHGSKFPWYFEKLIFLFAILGVIFVGQWMWTESGWGSVILWPMTLCGVPFAAILSAEFASRVIQSIHIRYTK